MFKKIIITLLTLFLLTSCGDSDESTTSNDTSVTGLVSKSFDNFSISIPSQWDMITQDEKILPIPSNGKIELAATSKKKTDGFYNNILILSDKLESFSSSKDFAIMNNLGASEEYLEYIDLDSKGFTFADGEESMIYVFEAKYNVNTPKLKFLQTARVCNATDGYLLTIALPASVKKVGQYEQLLQTFACNIADEL